MSTRSDIVDQLFAGRGESSPERSRRHYNLALKAARAWASTGGGTEACVLGLEALKELALDADVPDTRASFWKQAFQALSWTEGVDTWVKADEFASLAVDVFQDRLARLDIGERQRNLRSARDQVDEALKTFTEPQKAGPLLARKSALLRHLSLLDPVDFRLRRLAEAHRAASRALELHRDASTILEFAMAEWTLARHEKTDADYASRLRQAEQAFLDPALNTFEPAEFATARFYRLTFRGLDAAQQFLLSADRTVNRRRLWRESPIFAEAAILLSYASYPEPLLSDHLSKARNLLETALAAGYRHARIVIDLAFIQAILGGPDAGLTALGDLQSDRGYMQWQQALSLIAQQTESDLPALGFALGIDHSGLLTRLGTFIKRFLDDDTLAEALYRAAIRCEPHDPIALTNLARLLVHHGDPTALREARRLLQTAQNFADRRFRWWRAVLAELDSLEQPTARATAHQDNQRASRDSQASPPLRDFKQIRKWYQHILGISDHQQRGYELERLIYSLANITFGTVGPSYRFNRPLVNKTHQMDAFISHRGDRYRCEFKWQERKIGYDDMLKFFDKLDVAGVSGLFISMSGFDDGAISKAQDVRNQRVVILMDGEEVDLVLSGRLNFDEVMTIKRAYFDQRSDVYHRVVRVAETA